MIDGRQEMEKRRTVVAGRQEMERRAVMDGRRWRGGQWWQAGRRWRGRQWWQAGDGEERFLQFDIHTDYMASELSKYHLEVWCFTEISHSDLRLDLMQLPQSDHLHPAQLSDRGGRARGEETNRGRTPCRRERGG
jgi:hypothetical protein